jgi:DNA repair exonuclease SbcCD nuclease subunit
MKIVLVTDLHFGARNDSVKVAKHQKRFYDEVFFPYLKENNIDTIIDLGDTFDRRKYISFTSLKSATEMFFNPLKENNITTHMIVGNHDTVYKNTNELNSVNLLLQAYDNIIEYESPTDIQIDGCDILMLPWICKDNYDQTMNIIDKTKAQVVFSHLELKGFEFMRGHFMHEGMDHKIFDKFDLVCSGHYHHKSTEGNINYLGTPYELTWQDYQDEKGFHVFDTETRELTRVVSPLNMFYKLWYDDTNMTFEDIAKIDFTQYKDCFVKVIITNKTNPYLFDSYIERLDKNDLANLQIVEDHLNLDLTEDEHIVDEAEDTVTILDKYVDGLEISSDKDKVKTLLRNLYDEALSIT